MKIVGKTAFYRTIKDKDGNEVGGIFVRIKDGKARVAAIPQ